MCFTREWSSLDVLVFTVAVAAVVTNCASPPTEVVGCPPVAQYACTCPGGGLGTSTCLPSGGGWGLCTGCGDAVDDASELGSAADTTDAASQDTPTFEVDGVDVGVDSYGNETFDVEVFDDAIETDGKEPEVVQDIQACTPVACDDGDPCTVDYCAQGTCQHKANVASCDDGDACTSGDTCLDGVCTGTKATCDDGNVCTADYCDSTKGCQGLNVALPCDDGSACTVQDICTVGKCGGTPVPCDDGNVCTDDACSAQTGCTHTFNSLPCDDGDACTSGDTCSEGACTAGPAACEVLIPQGSFLMGCVPGDPDCDTCSPDNIDCRINEKPRHKVTLSAYYIDIYETTVARYAKCVSSGKCSEPAPGSVCNWGKAGRGQHPVNCISWKQADAYCKWTGGRLPTEAEWERAARGGLDGKLYPWGDESPTCTPGQPNTVVKGEYAGPAGCGKETTWVVGTGSTKNGFGLYDMAGNVSEYVSDYYGKLYYWGSPEMNPPGPGIGPNYNESRGYRGGGFGSGDAVDANLRASSRGSVNPYTSVQPSRGFRCARAAP
jgi:formylglycine-generating enzyme required for sulfatase activity